MSVHMDKLQRSKIYADEVMKNHRVERLYEQCYRVSDPESWNYGFYISFAPGHIFIGGDIGAMVIVHYSAAKTEENALRWLGGANADLDYFLSKTTAKQVMDRAATLEMLKKDYENQSSTEQSYKSQHWFLYEEVMDCGSDHEVQQAIYDSRLYDDWYGSYDYEEREMFKMACILNAARMIRSKYHGQD